MNTKVLRERNKRRWSSGCYSCGNDGGLPESGDPRVDIDELLEAVERQVSDIEHLTRALQRVES